MKKKWDTSKEWRKDKEIVVHLAERYDVHYGQIQAWRKSYLEGAAGVFDGNQDQRQNDDDALDARLYQLIS